MKMLLAHIRNFESFLDDYPAAFDAWEAGGVDGLVLGHMQFSQRELQSHSRHALPFPANGVQRAAFDPDRRIYATFGVEAPEPPPDGDEDRELRSRLAAALEAAVDRGWEVWLYDPFAGAPGVPGLGGNPARILNERAQACLAARMIDTIQAFPMTTGVIIDGPAWGYEIGPIEEIGQGLERIKVIFDELPPSMEADCKRLGYDYAGLVSAKDSLWMALHDLTPSRVRLHAAGGLTGGLQMVGGDGLAEWLAFRNESLVDFTATMFGALGTYTEHAVRMAVSPRQPAVAPLAGYDYQRIAEHSDIVMPKFYYWHRGFDGLIGTWWRWVCTLTKWNPSLSVADACQFTKMFFGDGVPVVEDLADFDLVLTPEYLRELARSDARRVVAAVGDPARVVPWIDGGRAPHDGDSLTAAHLHATLEAAASADITRVCYLNATNLTESDWSVLSRHCGTTWHRDSTDWRPDDRPTA